MSQTNRPLGTVVGGSLSRGIDVRFASPADCEQAKVGTFVTIQGSWHRFFGLINDLRLETSDPRFIASTYESDPALLDILSGTTTYGMASVVPMLTLGVGDSTLKPAKSIPAHFARVDRASNEDVQSIFGTEDANHIWVGSPLDMEETRICLDLRELVKRSNGVFGKSGTGKSFLTRIILAGIHQKRVATNLVFDMHSEYGWQSTSETGYSAKGLKQLFGGRVSVFSLDEGSSRRRGLSPDGIARIGLDEIEPDDVAILSQTLNITELGVQASHSLYRYFGKTWVANLIDTTADEITALADRIRENPTTINALRQRMTQLKRFDFVTENSDFSDGTVHRILDHLGDGRDVVLEFGRYGDDLTAYLLVTNLITRRIYQDYRRRTEDAQSGGTGSPTPLVITVEEAHRFLQPGIASQTIFGTIAREMRKYQVTLLVVDQRPSGIDSEVLSQIGTRITCQLDNDRDVDAVLAGASSARELRTVLARLESRQQSLMFGHALPMPVVVRTRNYDQALYEELTTPGHKGAMRADLSDKRDLFG